MTPLTLCLVVHDATSPGERLDVVQRLHDRALRPLLDALLAEPSVRLGLYLSGTLGAWMEEEAGGSLELLRGLVEREQVELLSGSPSLAALQGIPDRDAAAHLQAAERWLQASFGQKPRGAWLGRAGYDGELPRLLARAGLGFTFVSRPLLETNGRDCDGRAAWYVVERDGAAVGAIPVDPRLSAFLPWGGTHGLRSELRYRHQAGEQFVTAQVALEDLGLRHGSQRWCWNASVGFLPAFLRMVGEAADWLRTQRPCALIDGTRPGGRRCPSAGVDSPEALDPALLPAWDRARREIEEGQDPTLLRFSRWVGPPPWGACLLVSEERNLLHKRGLRASALVQRLRRQLRDGSGRADAARARALEETRSLLLTWQQGALMHGAPLGGIERADLRQAAWRALLRTELLCRQALGEASQHRHELLDLDCDGQREVLVQGPHMSALIRPAAGGALVELGLWRHGNLASVAARLPRPWQEEVLSAARLPALVGEEGTASLLGSVEEELVSLHIEESLISTPPELFMAQAPALPEQPALPLPDFDPTLGLVVDRGPRALFQDHFLAPGTRLDGLRRDQHAQDGDFLHDPYTLLSCERREDGAVALVMAREGVVLSEGQERLVRVLKRFVLPADAARVEAAYEVANRYQEPVRTQFAVAFNLGLDGRIGPQRFVQTEQRRAMLDEDGTVEGVRKLAWVLGDQGLRVLIECSEPATLHFFALRSLLRTCEGYTEAMQGTCLMLAWPLDLWGEERRRFELSLQVDLPRER